MKAFAKRTRRTMRLQTRMLLLVLLPLMLLALALQVMNITTQLSDSRSMLDNQRQALVKAREQGIKDVVESAQTSLRHLVEAGELSRAEAQARAHDIVRSLRFDGGNYIFVYDYQGVVVVHPFMPHLEGRNLWELQGPDGDYLVQELVSRARQGGGFYRHDWENPATQQVEPKYSYSVAIPEWEWMMGSGIYLNEVDEAMATAEAQLGQELRRSIIASAILTIVLDRKSVV